MPRESVPVRRLLLLRHGQTTANVAGALDTAVPGADLTELGRRQASAVPAAVAHEDVDAIHASTLVRTQQTAEPLAAARGLEVRVLEGLQEIAAGDLEMLLDEASREAYAEGLRRWMLGDLDAALPGGESGHAFLARYIAALRQATCAPGTGTVVVFSHGAAIRVAVSSLVGLPPAEAVDLSIANTGGALLERSDDRWSLVQWTATPIGGAELDDPSAADPTGDDVTDETQGR
ncbi:histidine phosphatase family protein [Nocardioides lijunqiniae]|uniref:histidine phosphatase family protein n=1 Tax=Nocardioides lijunqiniae TaxID=2760832 RepID=UPI0030B8430F